MIATYARVQWGKVLIALAVIATAMGFAVSSAAPARATVSDYTTVFWAIPSGGGHTQSTAFNGGPQTYYSVGSWNNGSPTSNTALQCGVWYQVDHYRTDTTARQSRLTSIMSDGQLAAGEDWNGSDSATNLFYYSGTEWVYVYGGDCAPPPVDVCANIDGVQASVPDGLIQDGEDCVPPPVDVCANIDGVQVAVPDGLIQDGEDCVPPPVDVCANIDGVQVAVPDGLIQDGEDCVPPPVDVCANIDGVQVAVPDGLIQDGEDCVPPPVDVCSNIDGVQLVVPEDYTAIDGVCDPTTTTTPPVDVCSNIDGVQLVVPEGDILANGECLTDETLDTSSTPTLTEVTLAATGAGGSSGTAAFAVALALGGLGLLLLRRRSAEEI